MDFKATNWLERNYKWFSAIILVILTICAIFYYFKLSDNNYTFIVSLGYAFILFLAGIFINYMHNTIESKIDDHLAAYCNLKRIVASYSASNDNVSIDDIKSKILWSQGFTGREGPFSGKFDEPYINQDGIKLTDDIDKIEKNFLSKHTTLGQDLQRTIDNYVSENNISLKNAGASSVYSVSTFDPEIWCQENLQFPVQDSPKMIKFLFHELSKLRDSIDNLEALGSRLVYSYSSYVIQAKREMKQIERLHGRKWRFYMQQHDQIYTLNNSIVTFVKELRADLYNYLKPLGNDIKNSQMEHFKIISKLDAICNTLNNFDQDKI